MGSGGGACHYCRKTACICDDQELRSDVEIARDAWRTRAQTAEAQVEDVRVFLAMHKLLAAYDLRCAQVKRQALP